MPRRTHFDEPREARRPSKKQRRRLRKAIAQGRTASVTAVDPRRQEAHHAASR